MNKNNIKKDTVVVVPPRVSYTSSFLVVGFFLRSWKSVLLCWALFCFFEREGEEVGERDAVLSGCFSLSALFFSVLICLFFVMSFEFISYMCVSICVIIIVIINN